MADTGLPAVPKLHTINDAARLLSVSRRTLYRLIDADELDTVRIGRRQFVPAAQLDDLIARGGAEVPTEEEEGPDGSAA